MTTAARSNARTDISTVSEKHVVRRRCAKNMPAAIIEKLNIKINSAIAYPKLKARFAEMIGTMLAGTPADFDKLTTDETEKRAKVFELGIMKPD